MELSNQLETFTCNPNAWSAQKIAVASLSQQPTEQPTEQPETELYLILAYHLVVKPMGALHSVSGATAVVTQLGCFGKARDVG